MRLRLRAILRRPGFLAGCALALACTVLSLSTSTGTLATMMAHPVRVAAHGGIPEPTLDGALALRVALATLPWVAILFLTAASLVGAPLATPDRGAAPSSASRLVLLLSLTVGLLLRLLHMGDSLWYDELAGLLGYSQYSPLVIAGNYFSQANHPLSQIAIWLSATLLGVNEITVRLPALLASTAAIPAAWLLGREARGEGTGLLMAATMALMPVAVLTGSDARGYAFVILLATLAGWLILLGLRTASPVVWIALAIVHALMVWSHLAAVCVALGQGIYLLAALRQRALHRNAASGVLALAAAAALTLLLHAGLLPDLLSKRASFSAAGGVGPRLLGPEMLHGLYAWGGSWTGWAAAPGLALAAIGLVAACRDRRLRRALAVTALCVPFAIVLAWVGDSWLYARFLLFGVPAASLLIACGLGTVARAGSAPLALATAAFVAAGAIDLLRLPPRQDLRTAVDVAYRPLAGRPPSVASLGLNDQVLLYYVQSSKRNIADLGLEAHALASELDRLGPDRVIVLYPSLRPSERVEQLKARGYQLAEELPGWIDWGEGAVQVWERRDSVVP